MAQFRTLECDCVVVGGGLLGLVTAELAAGRGHRVVVFSPPRTAGLPEADSQRNHAWLQSGLLYSDQPAAARLMATWGTRLLERYDVAAPQEQGIFCFDGEPEVAVFERHARWLGLTSAVHALRDERKLRRRLGPFLSRGKLHYGVPDAPFDEGALMETVRARARSQGVIFRRARVQLHIADGSRLLVRTDEEAIEAANVALCAGAAIPELLAPLGLQVPLAVFRSPLLRLASDALMSAALFVDRTTGLSAVRHDRTRVPPSGAVVVGNRRRTRVPHASVAERIVSEPEARELLGLCHALSATGPIRFTAGFKTEHAPTDVQSSVHPWIWRAECPRGLTVGVPGKATLSLYAAECVVGTFSTHKGSTDAPRGVDWTERIRLHHEAPYRAIDEAIVREGDPPGP